MRLTAVTLLGRVICGVATSGLPSLRCMNVATIEPILYLKKTESPVTEKIRSVHNGRHLLQRCKCRRLSDNFSTQGRGNIFRLNHVYVYLLVKTDSSTVNKARRDTTNIQRIEYISVCLPRPITQR